MQHRHAERRACGLWPICITALLVGTLALPSVAAAQADSLCVRSKSLTLEAQDLQRRLRVRLASLGLGVDVEPCSAALEPYLLHVGDVEEAVAVELLDPSGQSLVGWRLPSQGQHPGDLAHAVALLVAEALQPVVLRQVASPPGPLRENDDRVADAPADAPAASPAPEAAGESLVEAKPEQPRPPDGACVQSCPPAKEPVLGTCGAGPAGVLGPDGMGLRAGFVVGASLASAGWLGRLDLIVWQPREYRGPDYRLHVGGGALHVSAGPGTEVGPLRLTLLGRLGVRASTTLLADGRAGEQSRMFLGVGLGVGLEASLLIARSWRVSVRAAADRYLSYQGLFVDGVEVASTGAVLGMGLAIAEYEW